MDHHGGRRGGRHRRGSVDHRAEQERFARSQHGRRWRIGEQSQEQPSNGQNSTPNSGENNSSGSGPSTDSGGSSSGILDIQQAEDDAQTFVDDLSSADYTGAKLYVCSADKDTFETAASGGQLDSYKGLTLVVEGSEQTGDSTAIVTITADKASGSIPIPMSFIGSLWYVCPSDQPNVDYGG